MTQIYCSNLFLNELWFFFITINWFNTFANVLLNSSYNYRLLSCHVKCNRIIELMSMQNVFWQVTPTMIKTSKYWYKGITLNSLKSYDKTCLIVVIWWTGVISYSLPANGAPMIKHWSRWQQSKQHCPSRLLSIC